MLHSVWIGFDPREGNAFSVLRHSIMSRSALPRPIKGLVLDRLRESGIYHRPTSQDELGRLWDDISGAPMATEFSISRFLVPHLVKARTKKTLVKPHGRWAVFMDCDMLVTCDIGDLFELADPQYAVMVVKHDHQPMDTSKMDGQIQTRYHRKNWSSVMLFNVDHPANEALTVDLVNSLPGRDLHRFCWLKDHEIGELPVEWNYLVGWDKSSELPDGQPPANIHFTEGIPTMPSYATCEYADLWFEEQRRWAD